MIAPALFFLTLTLILTLAPQTRAFPTLPGLRDTILENIKGRQALSIKEATSPISFLSKAMEAEALEKIAEEESHETAKAFKAAALLMKHTNRDLTERGTLAPSFEHLLSKSEWTGATGKIADKFRDLDDLKEDARLQFMLEGKHLEAKGDGTPKYWISPCETVVSFTNYINFKTPFNVFSNFNAPQDPTRTKKMILSHCIASDSERMLDHNILPLSDVLKPAIDMFRGVTELVLQNCTFLSALKDEEKFLSKEMFPSLKKILIVGKRMESSVEFIKEVARERLIDISYDYSN